MRTYKSLVIDFVKIDNGKEKKTGSIPMKTAGMISKASTGFKQACPDCHNHVGRKNWCDECDKEIEFGRILKGIEDKVFSKEQLDSLKTFDQRIKVLGTYPIESLDIRKVNGGYFLLPVQTKKGASKSAKASRNLNDYSTLLSGLAKNNMILLVEFCVSSVQKLGVIIPQGNELILKEYAYHENLNINDEEMDYTPSEQEVVGITKFLKTQNKIDDIEAIENQYQAKVQALIDGEIDVEQIEVEPPTSEARFFE